MEFLDRFAGANRERLMAAGRTLRLTNGQFLIRRGEKGGDIYFIEEGRLEVVDSRATPEVVLHVVPPGAVVGEVAFLDAAPRSADVRAQGEVVVRVWEHEALSRVLAAEPDFAAVFFRALAEVSVDRLRSITASAASGSLSPRRSQEISMDGRSAALELTSKVVAAWLGADDRLRRQAGEGSARTLVAEALQRLVSEGGARIANLPGPEERTFAGELMGRELRPWLARSRLGALAFDAGGRTGGGALLDHVQAGRPAGEGELGLALDEALLQMPTPSGIRRRSELGGRTLGALLPGDRPVSILVVGASARPLIERAAHHLSRPGASLRVLDGDRAALSAIEGALRRPGLSVTLQEVDLAAMAMEGRFTAGASFDYIVVDGLCDYLPDRLVASLLSALKPALEPGGMVLLTGLAPGRDAPIVDDVLLWPLIRRSGRDLRALVEAMGFVGAVVLGAESSPDAGVVVTGRLRVRPAPQPSARGGLAAGPDPA
jgi:CRP-like cAMP-binding protein